MSQQKILSGVPEGLRPFIINRFFSQNPQILIAFSSSIQARSLFHQLKVIFPGIPVYLFPERDCLPYQGLSPSVKINAQRMSLLSQLADEKIEQGVFITSVKGMMDRLPPPISLMGEAIEIQESQTLSRDIFIRSLQEKGYQAVESVYLPGEVSVRGHLIDLFPVGADCPVRIDLFGDLIEKIRSFDPLTQKSTGVVEGSISIYPAQEVLLSALTIERFQNSYFFKDRFYESVSNHCNVQGQEDWLPCFYESLGSFRDYLKNPLLVLDEQAPETFSKNFQTIESYYEQQKQTFSHKNSQPLIPPCDLFISNQEWREIYSQATILSPFQNPQGLSEEGRELWLPPTKDPATENSLEQIVNFIESQKEKKICVIACSTEGSRQRVFSYLKEHNISGVLPVDKWPSLESDPCKIYLVCVSFEKGFLSPQWLVLTESDVLGQTFKKKARPKQKNLMNEVKAFEIHEYIVHRDHGIGQYLGLETLKVDNTLHDCLTLLYEGGDKIFLPIEHIDKVSSYGSSDSTVSLDRLGTSHWQNRQARVKNRIKEVADHLIRLAAQRSLLTAPSFDILEKEYEDFCKRFPYEETEDQAKAINDVLEDLASGKPMDRLVCGDVGFGKTEVALRAAFLVALQGKQVAFIAPTTLLCRQHFKTFQERFKGTSIQVAQLSRLVSPKESQEIQKRISDGSVRVLIATHSLLNKKINFADLGLVIVDEEQHFGVKQKEKLKDLKTDVHLLTLTATPIPRTLQLAVTGVRDLSLMTTPPLNRQAIQTFILSYNPLTVKEAIAREIQRGGQVLYVTPRIERISRIEEFIRENFPKTHLGVAHGQLAPQELEKVMASFYERHLDILLATNIVESGIDVPTANTLIIDRADLFGLAQLYQIRGRVGRSQTQSYAYLTYPDQDLLSSNAQKRLRVIQSLDTLGAGFQIASHDLDIRGAGNIIGEEQSGHIKEVGIELYQQLLQEAILTLRMEEAGEAIVIPQEAFSPQINIGVSFLIPETYIPELGTRLIFYRRLADLKTRAEIDVLSAEMIDRFGVLPQEVFHLLEVMEFKILCLKGFIDKLDLGPKGVMIGFFKNQFPSPQRLLTFLQSELIQKIAKVSIKPDQKIVFAGEWGDHSNRLKITKKILKVIAKLGEASVQESC